MYWHHKFKSKELQVIYKRNEQKTKVSIWAYKMRDFKNIFPGL